MSLILDALNRSQAERGADTEIPGIETQHWVEPQPYAGRLQRVLPWIALGLSLLVIVWLLVSRGGEPDSASEALQAPISEQLRDQPKLDIRENAPGSVTASKVSAREVPPVASSAQVQTRLDSSVVSEGESLQMPSVDNNAAVSDLYSNAEVGKTAQGVLPDTSVEAAPEVSPAAEPVLPATETAAATQPQLEEQAIDIEEMVELVRRESENAELSEHSAKFLSQLSQQKKDQIPTIYYTQHDYSSTPSQSSVTLNGKLVRVGAKVAGNIKLLEILPNSIVLSDKGTEFRLRALNSWVNL